MEFRIVGGPGTGKTTTLARMIEGDVERRGPQAVTVAAFTRAAAVELKGRDLPIPDTHVGTLHSICWRMLGRPTVAETKIAQFNQEYGWQMESKGARGSIDDLGVRGGNTPLEEYQLARGMMGEAPRTQFAKEWEAWKRKEGYVDFTDMIDMVRKEGRPPPEGTEVLYVDEAQDLKPLEMALVRQWGEKLDRHYIVGDPRQCLYEWLGASPRLFLNPAIPEAQMMELPVSRRLPEKVWLYAQQVADMLVEDHGRQEYGPRGAIGDLGFVGRSPEEVVYDAMSRGGTTMILATCGYLLGPVIRVLRDEGVPYWNPYRADRGDWNPMRRGREGETPTWQRLLEWKNGPWDNDYISDAQRRVSLRIWLPLVRKTGVLKRGLKLEEEFDLDDMWAEGGWEFSGRREPNYIVDHAAGGKESALTYMLKVIERYGEAGLSDPPRLIVGTGHSVKGGEADNVYILPDISAMARREAFGGSDGLVRLLYVMATRARESLWIAGQRTKHAMALPQGAGW